VVFFKISLFPFHRWVQDVTISCEGGILLTFLGLFLPLLACGYLHLLRILLQDANDSLQQTLIVVIHAMAIFSVFYGNILALQENNIKRALSYTIMALMAPVLTISPLGLNGYNKEIMFYLFFVCTSVSGLFLLISELQNQEQKSANPLWGLFARNRFYGILTTIFLASLAGAPLTYGFVSRYLIAVAQMQEKYYWTLVGLSAGNLIGMYFYGLQILKIFQEREQREVRAKNGFVLASNKNLVYLILAALTLIMGIIPGSIWTSFFTDK